MVMCSALAQFQLVPIFFFAKGTRLVGLCEHEARVGAAKTANRFTRLRGSTHVLCTVQTAAVIAWM